jgi:hypothetical protein
MSTSRAGRGTLKRVAIPPQKNRKKPKPETATSTGSGGRHAKAAEEVEEEEDDAAACDDNVAILEGFTGLGRAACVALLSRAGGDVEAAVNRHFVTLSPVKPPPRQLKKKKHSDEGLPVIEEDEVERKRKSQRTLAQSGFAALAPGAVSVQELSATAMATVAAATPPTSEPPLFRPPPLAPRRRVAIASCGERWRGVANEYLADYVPQCPREASESASVSSPASASTMVVTDARELQHARGKAASAAVVMAPTSTDPFTASLRGRAIRGRTCAPPPPPGTLVSLEREADNRMDPRAIRCFLLKHATVADAERCSTHDLDDDASRFLGYLPRGVSCHLAPWIDSGALSVLGRTSISAVALDSLAVKTVDGVEGVSTTTSTATTTTHGEEPETNDVTVHLIATIIAPDAMGNDEGETATNGAAAGWGAAAAAAAAAAEEDAAGGGSRLTELTRKRMWLTVNQIRASSDAVLLTSNETDALDALDALDHTTQSLAVRLLQRKSGWIRIPTLEGRYREVRDAASAAEALFAAGLVRSAEEDCIITPGGGNGSSSRDCGGCLHGENVYEKEKALRRHRGGGDRGQRQDTGGGGDTRVDEMEDDLRGRLGALTREELAEMAHVLGKPDRGRRYDVTTALLSAPSDVVLAAWRSAMNGSGGGGGTGVMLDAEGSRGHGGVGREGLVEIHQSQECGSVVALGGALHLAPDLVSALRMVMFLTFLDFSVSNLQYLVLQEIGVVRFPQREEDDEVEVGVGGVSMAEGETDMAPPVFSSRTALDEYVAAAEVAGHVDAALEAGDEAEALRLLMPVLTLFLEADHGEDVELRPLNTATADTCKHDEYVFARFDASWVQAQMATVGVGLLERRGRYADATHVLLALLSGCAAPDRRGGWYVRTVTNLGSHLGRASAALRACEAGLADTWVRCGHRLGLQRRALRLAKKCKRWALAGATWRGDAEWEAPLERVHGVALNAHVQEKNRYHLNLAGEVRLGLTAVDERGKDTTATEGGCLGDEDVIVIDGNRLGVTDADTGGHLAKTEVATTVEEDLEVQKDVRCVLEDGDVPAVEQVEEEVSFIVSVEELALAYYASPVGGGWRGVHSEGTAWNTLFGLLFADILLTSPPDVPKRGVFRSPFQSGPLDLCADVFLLRRHRAVTSRLDDIRGGTASRLLTTAWTTHYGSFLRGVSWTLLTLQELRDVAEGLGGAALASVCALKAEDYGSWGGGMPDLLLWRPASSIPASPRGEVAVIGDQAGGGCGTASKAAAKAVEVKSRNDTLSDQQRAWLLALRDAGVSVAVCKVQ